MKRLGSVLTTIVAMVGLAFTARAGQIQVAWDAVAGATGYKVYYGTSSGQYSSSVAVSSTSATLTNLTDCRNYFVAVKAVNGAGESSQYSNELSGWARPTVTSSSPGAVMQGDQAVVTLNGTNFQSGATVTVDGNPFVMISSVSVLSCNQIQMLASVDPPGPSMRPAEVGSFSITVANPDDVFGQKSDVFTVLVNPARFDINKTDASTAGRIDGKDTIWIARLFGYSESSPSYDPDADFNGDGWVDGDDISYVASSMGGCWNGSGWDAAACPANLR